MTKILTDSELVLRLAQGDTAAMEALHARHAGLVRHIAFRVLRNRTLAEDAAQDAFLDFWRTSGNFDATRASISTWLCVLAHRRAVDLARREARRRATDGSAVALDPESYIFDETVVLESERRRVRRAVAELSARDRDLIELSYYGGLTRSQVAERTGLPLGTVKRAIFDALAQLQRTLAASLEPA